MNRLENLGSPKKTDAESLQEEVGSVKLVAVPRERKVERLFAQFTGTKSVVLSRAAPSQVYEVQNSVKCTGRGLLRQVNALRVYPAVKLNAQFQTA